jgi:two-component SAPR family response regulator
MINCIQSGTRGETMNNLAINTLGKSEVLVDGIPAEWHAQAAQELFFYLLSHVEGCSKEEILEQLWGLEPDPSSNNRFRVTVHRVRTALGRSDALQEEYGRYRLSSEVLMATDVHQLYLTLEQANHTSEPAVRQRLYQHVLNLYHGDYLPGEHADWAREAREEYKSAYVRAALELSLIHCDHGSCDAAVGALVRALKADPFIGENYHQKLMTCLSVVEGKYASIEHYRRFLSFLREELDDTPMGETKDLAERIKAGESICNRRPDEHLTLNCPLTSDGSCPGVFGELIKLS